MWMVYKTREGDTMDTIIAKQKIKDPATVLTHKDNKKIYRDLKAGKPLPKNTPVTIPDPKTKLYRVQTKTGEQVMTEKQYKDYLKVVHEKMDEVVFKLRQRLTYAQGRHDAQRKINKDQWFVAACLNALSSFDEPTNRKQAEAAFKKVESAAKSRNYKGFEKAVEPANIAIAQYKTDTILWIDGLINAGENTVTALEGVKTVGMVCGAVAATTVIAPVGLTAGVLTGAGVGGGTQMAYDGFDSIGRAIAGTKQRSTEETLKRAAGGALAGAAGAAVVGVIMKGGSAYVVKYARSSKFLEKQVQRILSRGPLNFKELYAAEVKGMAKRLGVNSTDSLLAARGKIMDVALSKFMLRVGMGSVSKKLEGGKFMKENVVDWIAGDQKRVAGKDPDKTAKAFAKDLAASGKLDKVFDETVTENTSKFTKILRQEIKAAALAELKKQKA